MILLNTILKKFNGKIFGQFVSCILGTLTAFSCAQICIWPSTILPKLMANDSSIPVSHTEGAWIISLFLGVEPIGAIASLYTMKIVGSKHTILLSTIPNAISSLLLAFSHSTMPLYLSRISGSFGDAFIFNGVTAYIGEIAEPKYRGGLITIFMVLYQIGCVYTYYFGFVLSIQTFALITFGCVIVQAILFLFVPQSPTFLVKNNEIDKAKNVLFKLRKSVLLGDKELDDIRNVLVNENECRLKDLFQITVNRKAMSIIILIIWVWQFSGGTAMTMYLRIIVQEAQLQVDDFLPILLYGIIQIISCLVAVFLIDWIGRRILLLSSCFGSISTLLVISEYFYLKNEEYPLENITWLPILALSLFVFLNTIGLSTVSTVYTSEVFAYNMQCYSGAVACSASGIFGLITNVLFDIVKEKFGMDTIFLLFAVCTLIGTVVIYYYVPETKNKSLIEIQEILRRNNNSTNVIIDKNNNETSFCEVVLY